MLDIYGASCCVKKDPLIIRFGVYHSVSPIRFGVLDKVCLVMAVEARGRIFVPRWRLRLNRHSCYVCGVSCFPSFSIGVFRVLGVVHLVFRLL